jgi:hypothetical protein
MHNFFARRIGCGNGAACELAESWMIGIASESEGALNLSNIIRAIPTGNCI